MSEEVQRASDWFELVCVSDFFAGLRIEDGAWVLSTTAHGEVRGEPLGSPLACVVLAYRAAVARGDGETQV